MKLRRTPTALKSILIGAFMAASIAAPAAYAEAVEVMVLSTRCDDGIYRPSVRVIRGGDVTFYSSCSTPPRVSDLLCNWDLVHAY